MFISDDLSLVIYFQVNMENPIKYKLIKIIRIKLYLNELFWLKSKKFF